MEANICDVNQLDADVLLPPRKRLLAGLKKQSCDGDCSSNGSYPASSSSSTMFDTRLNNLLSSHTSNPDLSPEEIAESSRKAAEAAAKAARAARANAEEKAAIAARAVAAAKSALDLVASFSEEASSRDSHLRKNKLKKHVHVNSLYKQRRPVENCKTDEELARKLHRAINSSPRILKNSSSSGSRVGRHKKLKITFPPEKPRASDDEDTESERELESPKCNGLSVGPADSPNNRGIRRTKPLVQSEMENGESSNSKKKLSPGEGSPNSQRRGRLKLKKLPLSICGFKDETTDDRTGPPGETKTGNGLFSNGTSSDSLPRQLETAPTTPVWKCQDFHAPACVKQNKVAQS